MAEATTIGHYRILEPLGRGGMGIVHRARHVNSDRAIALKTVEVPTSKWNNSIRREIQALTRIRHPGVVRILDHGEHEGRPWYAMDLVEGESLRRFIQRLWSNYRPIATPLTSTAQLGQTEDVSGDSTIVSESDVTDKSLRSSSASVPGTPTAGAGQLTAILKIMRRMCASLAFLHGEGFVNGDLKPDNVLLVGEQPVIIDFGLTSHHPGQSSREELAAQRGLSGTLPYASPEQLRGEFLDARSDLYSVGCMLYELVTGILPFSGAPRLIIKQHLSNIPKRPSEIVEGVPPKLDRLILKLLDKNPADRCAYADDVAVELAELSGDSQRLSELPPVRSYLYRPRFVGREAAVEQLAGLRYRAVQGSGALVLVSGVSGVGKTRFAMELTRILPNAPMRVVTSEASALAVQSAAAVAPAPLHALRSLLQEVADQCHAGGPDVTGQLLGHRRSVLALYEPLLAHVPSNEPMSPVAPLSAEASRQRLFKYLADTTAAFMQAQPLMWIIDDLGWADELSLAFLKSLTSDYLEAQPIFIIATYRSEEPSEGIAALARNPHVVQVNLPRLEKVAVDHMIRDMLAISEPLGRFNDYVARQAEGNPFFVAEYLRTAVSEQILHRDQRLTWLLRSPENETALDFESLPLPHSVLAIIEHRLRTLSPGARQMSLAAAVLGRETAIETLREVAALTEESAASAIDELIRRQVLEQSGADNVRFAHDKLREVTYGQAPVDDVRALHLMAANLLQKRASDLESARQLWATLGHHFMAAQQPEPAAQYLAKAADHAKSIHANDEAIRLYQEAIRQVNQLRIGLESGPAQWQEMSIVLNESLGDVLALTARRNEARAAFDQALSMLTLDHTIYRPRLNRKIGKTWEAEHRQDEALSSYNAARSAFATDMVPTDFDLRNEWIQLRIELLWLHYWKNRVAEMETISAELGPIVPEHGTSSQRARYFHTQALKNLRRDRYEVSEETLLFARQAVLACRDVDASAEMPMVQFLLGFALLFHNSLQEASSELKLALAHAERDGDMAQQARCLAYMTLAARQLGSIDETSRLAAQSEDVSSRSSMREYLAAAWANQAWVALRQGSTDEAVELSVRARDTWLNINAVFPFVWMALLPLMAAELARKNVAEVAKCAQSILDPNQHALPLIIRDRLTEALDGWTNNQPLEAQSSFESAIAAATHLRYV